jgi:UDP-N-acetylmuramoylalanine--D-glutamate ligase
MKFPGGTVKDDTIMIDDRKVCNTGELKLLGSHNWQNVCAAVTAVWKVTQNLEAIRSVLTTFSGLPFRIELRREVNGILYYNDSFASAPPAPVAAIEAIPGQKVMIIGGFDRNLELGELAESLVRLKGRIRRVLLIGASAKRTAEAFKQHGFDNFEISEAADMAAIVSQAQALARREDAVVLSPGFPSFDMFKNFEDRGLQFNAAVDKL